MVKTMFGHFNHPRRVIVVSLIAAVFLGIITWQLFWPSSDPSAPKTKQPQPEIAKRWSQPDVGIAYSSLPALFKDRQARSFILTPEGQGEVLFRDDSSRQFLFPEQALERIANQAGAGGSEVKIAPVLPEDLSAVDAIWDDTLSRSIMIIAIITIAIAVGYLIHTYWRRRHEEQISSFRFKNKPKNSNLSSGSKNTERPPVRFSDVAGCPEAVEEISEFLQFLRAPEAFQRLGAKMPSGAILHGPPGTGKTLLARALAGEAEVPFYSFAGSEAVNKYVGVGADKLRKLFNKARQSEDGAVIFIDEVDAIGRRRGSSGDQASQEYDQTLNQLLVELDGFNSSERLVVIAATNRLDILDPALLRPGRLSRSISVLPPAESGRLEILQLYSKGKPLADDVDLQALAKITAGSTGADLAEMINEAAIQAGREQRATITDSDLREGHLRALAGPKRVNSPLQPGERRQIAVHESGHVLAAELLPEHEKAQRVTIVARGQAAGLAVYGRQDRALQSPQYVQEQLIAILGGRAAERVVFGTVSSGAANDLQQANELARRAIEEWGLSELTGQLVSRGPGSAISDQTRSLVDQEVEAMVAESFRQAVELLEAHKQLLVDFSEQLLRQETMERVDILALIEGRSEQPVVHRGRHPSLQPALSMPERTAPAVSERHKKRSSPQPVMAWKQILLNWRRRRKAAAK